MTKFDLTRPNRTLWCIWPIFPLYTEKQHNRIKGSSDVYKWTNDVIFRYCYYWYVYNRYIRHIQPNTPNPNRGWASSLSHLLVHLPPRPLRSQIALFSIPRLISGINFHFHFVNQSHLFMLTSIHPSVLHSSHPSPLHSFTLNSKLTFLVNLFPHRSLTISISDWLPRLMGPFSVFTVFVGVIPCFWCGRQN